LSALRLCHFSVAASVCGFAMTVGPGALSTSTMLLGGLAPLAIGYRGLRAGSRYTLQWLAIAMVFYVGVGLAETVASLGATLAATGLTLTSATELALLLRALKRPSIAHRESAES
jgi:hypothetical protein